MDGPTNRRRSFRAWAETPAAAFVAAGWGMAEGTLFFVVPDVWIGAVALAGWRPGLRAAVSAVGGALVGGAVMHGVGARLEPERSARLLAAVPAVSPAMIEWVEAELREDGPAAMLRGPLRGTPYKIYARSAGVQGMPLPVVLAWSVPARAPRFVLSALAAAAVGRWLLPRLGGRVGWLVGLYALAWVGFYVRYFRRHGW